MEPDVTPQATPGQAAAEAWHARRFSAGKAVRLDEAYAHAQADWDAVAEAAWRAALPRLMAVADRHEAERDELAGTHATLLEEILRNAGEDIRSADEAPEYVAEHYVRTLERERDAAREELAAVTRDRDDAVTLLDGCQRELGLAIDRKRAAEADRDRYRQELERLTAGHSPVCDGGQCKYIAPGEEPR